MALVLNLPEDVERALRAASQTPLEQQALETLAVNWYRQGKLFHSQFAKLLGISRYQADEVLKRHGVVEEMTIESFEQQLAASRRVERP